MLIRVFDDNAIQYIVMYVSASKLLRKLLDTFNFCTKELVNRKLDNCSKSFAPKCKGRLWFLKNCYLKCVRL